jgi:transcriptional regulator with XRE-family HTH domain
MVRQLRLEKDWSKSELARQANLSVTAIKSVEEFRHRPTDVTVHKLASVFNIEFEKLYSILQEQYDAAVAARM